MASVKQNTTIKEYQSFVKEVYGLSNDRYFSLWNMVSNVERFMMRGLKGIRKNDKEKTKINLLIAFSWFMSTMNQLHIDIENQTWKRFPYLCSYCGSCPCSCKEKNIKKRKSISIDESKKPKTLEEFQNMFNKIYPADKRIIERAGIHLAEEAGEFSEALLTYRGGHKDEDFKNLELEAADFFSCALSVFNSLRISVAKELSIMFSNNCHVCKNAPCTCSFKDITDFNLNSNKL
ncbi:MAG: MazG-like family protein [Candidatus Nealsonbacteria bacterium]